MFGQWRAPDRHDASRDFENRHSSPVYVVNRVRYDVRMHVAVGDVAPDGVVQPVPLERRAVQRQRLFQPVEWNDYVASGFLDVLVQPRFGGGNPRVEARGHAFTERKQPHGAAIVSGECYVWVRIDRARGEHLVQLLQRLVAAARHLDLRQQEPRGGWWPRNV